MRTAITQGLAVTVLAVCLSASQNGPAQGEERPGPGRGPEASTPKPQARPEAAPKRMLPQPRPLQEGAPAAREEAPGAMQGCPDPGRKLELIV